jgi:putative ATP-binding cassette transporter
MKRQKTLTWFTSGYYQIATIFPFLVAAPRFFAKKIELGGLMQTASAFGQVQGSFSYIIDSYTSIATWKAVVDRLNGFTVHIEDARAQAEDATAFKPAPGNFSLLNAKNMTVQLPNGEPLLENVNLAISKGDTWLINGPSGSGKSTLLRIFAGIWPFAQGTLEVPQGASMLFLPQTPYLPLGTLRHALCYPFPATDDDAALRDLLTLCRLEQLTRRLDDVENWAHVLSPGEQQRIAFARAILIKPDYIFLDESTSALDEAMEAYLYKTLKERLPTATVVSIGHRATLKPWHDKVLNVGK